MEIIKTDIKDLYLIKTDCFEDKRGYFQKIFNFDFFAQNRLSTDFKEFYYSISKKDTIRGMHFQIPPHDHVKVVYISYGTIMDVIVDLRKDSFTSGKVFATELNHLSGNFLYIPRGLAHGFKSLSENAVVNYAQTTCYSREHDQGVLYSSINYDWQVDNPLVSDRDLGFSTLEDFQKRGLF